MTPRDRVVNDSTAALESLRIDTPSSTVSRLARVGDREHSRARIAKGVLGASGIELMIRSDDAGGMYPGIGGAYLLVRAEDVEKAKEALQRRYSPR